MNIYEKRLQKLTQMLLWIESYYSREEIRYWKDIKCNRDGAPQRLWNLRSRLGLTMEEFARSIDTSPERYEKIEKIGAKIPDSIIEQTSQKYDLDKEWLKGEK